MIKTTKGIITYNDLSYLENLNQYNLNQFLDSLKEDLLQITFKEKNIILDVGWYPEFDPTGSFAIKIINNFNWDKPMFEKRTTSIQDMYDIVNQEIIKIEQQETYNNS